MPKVQHEKASDPIAWALAVWEPGAHRVTITVYVHLKKAKAWREYETKRCEAMRDAVAWAEDLYPGITILEVVK